MALARDCNGVIINADSQQVYRDLRILTARPSAEEESRAPHKLYGFVDADQPFSAGIWLRYARMEIDWARSQGHTPIVCGGTGLYLKTLMQGIAEMPDVPDSVRQQADNDFEQMGKEAFCTRLHELDPIFFERLKVYDRQRLIRAYSIWLASGKSLSWWQSREVTPPYPADNFQLHIINLPRDELYARCDQRLRLMVDQGALDEVKHMQSLHIAPDLPIMKTIGIREFSDYLQGNCMLEDAIQTAQQATRNYAKRQMTWLRTQM